MCVAAWHRSVSVQGTPQIWADELSGVHFRRVDEVSSNMRFASPDGGGLDTAIVVPRIWQLELAKDRSEMSVDSALRKHELVRYSRIAQPARQQPPHVPLSPRRRSHPRPLASNSPAAAARCAFR